MSIALTRGDNVVQLLPRNRRKQLEGRAQKYTLRALGAYRAAADLRAKGDDAGVLAAKLVAAKYLEMARMALALIAEL